MCVPARFQRTELGKLHVPESIIGIERVPACTVASSLTSSRTLPEHENTGLDMGIVAWVRFQCAQVCWEC